MKTHLFCKTIISFVLLTLSTTFAQLDPDALDRKKVNDYYFDGEFEPVILELELFIKTHPNMSKRDRIFAYKHLSVVFAADPTTRLKGESYMYQLLKLAPTIEILDMYVSDNIKSIFNNVRTDYIKTEEYLLKKVRIESGLPEPEPEAIP